MVESRSLHGTDITLVYYDTIYDTDFLQVILTKPVLKWRVGGGGTSFSDHDTTSATVTKELLSFICMPRFTPTHDILC